MTAGLLFSVSVNSNGHLCVEYVRTLLGHLFHPFILPTSLSVSTLYPLSLAVYRCMRVCAGLCNLIIIVSRAITSGAIGIRIHLG